MVGSEIEVALDDQDVFARLDRWTEVESGVFWLAGVGQSGVPLADRVEQLVLEHLRSGEDISAHQVEVYVAGTLHGLLTPDRGLVMACLRSYAAQVDDSDRWELPKHETAQARREDCAKIVELLIALGERLGYKVKGKDPIHWTESKGKLSYRFHVQETAAMLPILEDESDPPIILVLPGGRAELVAEKARRDARVRTWLERGNCLVKFRHVRRMVEDPKLRRGNFAECLGLDPAEQQDPQMHLL
jgi:hypothetical protein